MVTCSLRGVVESWVPLGRHHEAAFQGTWVLSHEGRCEYPSAFLCGYFFWHVCDICSCLCVYTCVHVLMLSAIFFLDRFWLYLLRQGLSLNLADSMSLASQLSRDPVPPSWSYIQVGHHASRAFVWVLRISVLVLMLVPQHCMDLPSLQLSSVWFLTWEMFLSLQDVVLDWRESARFKKKQIFKFPIQIWVPGECAKCRNR